MEQKVLNLTAVCDQDGRVDVLGESSEIGESGKAERSDELVPE